METLVREPAPVGVVVKKSGMQLRWHSVLVPVAIFLVAFGLLNFAELPLGWKDRTDQIARYLDATVGLSDVWVMPALWLVKCVEGALGLTALAALLSRDARLLAGVIGGWLAVFTGFAAMDVWAADRAELQEHTVYFMAFSQLLLLVVITGMAERVVGWIQDRSGT